MKGSPRVVGIWGVVKVLAIDFQPVFGSPWLPLQGKWMILYQVLGLWPVSMLPVDWEGS